MRKREPPSALLTLSAIDLLLASLVCAVVLLIALVGSAARSGASNSQAISSSAAPVTLHLLFSAHPRGFGGVDRLAFNIEGAQELSPPVLASQDSLSASPFGLRPEFARNLHWWTLVAKPDITQLTFSGIPELVVASINLGTQGMYYLSLRCEKPDWTLKLSLHPLRVIDETCATREGTGLVAIASVPATPRIIVTTISPSTPAWKSLAPLKKQNGMVSTWVGTDKTIPADASTSIFTD